MKLPVPYERVVQWLAPPVSSALALGATALVHQNVSKSAALDTATFVLTVAAGIAAHHKWMDNLPKWWDVAPVAEEPTAEVLQDYEPTDHRPGSALAPEAGVTGPEGIVGPLEPVDPSKPPVNLGLAPENQ